MPRGVNSPSLRIQTTIALIVITIAQEHTLDRFGALLVLLVWSQIRIASTCKSAKDVIIRSTLKKQFIGRFRAQNQCGKPINEIGSSAKGLQPVFF